MLTSVRGAYRDGKIELYEKVTSIESDVALVLFPHSDLQAAKKRPALVVQRS
jgi:hypothetical protein